MSIEITVTDVDEEEQQKSQTEPTAGHVSKSVYIWIKFENGTRIFYAISQDLLSSFLSMTSLLERFK